MKEFEPFKQIYRQILQKPEIKENAKQAAVAVLWVEIDEQEPHLILHRCHNRPYSKHLPPPSLRNTT